MKSSGALDKILLKLRYLEKERDSCRDICDAARVELNSHIRNIHKDFNSFDKDLDSEQGCDIDSDKVKDNLKDHESKEKSSDAPRWAKKLFRKIVMITHPDKIPEKLDKNLKEKFLRIYKESKESIDAGDNIRLAMLASEIDIGLDRKDMTDLSEFHKKEKLLSSEIESLKGSMYWVWAHASDDEREKILKEFVNLRGWAKKENQRKKSRKGTGKHPGKSIAQMKKKKLYEKK